MKMSNFGTEGGLLSWQARLRDLLFRVGVSRVVSYILKVVIMLRSFHLIWLSSNETVPAQANPIQSNPVREGVLSTPTKTPHIDSLGL